MCWFCYIHIPFSLNNIFARCSFLAMVCFFSVCLCFFLFVCFCLVLSINFLYWNFSNLFSCSLENLASFSQYFLWQRFFWRNCATWLTLKKQQKDFAWIAQNPQLFLTSSCSSNHGFHSVNGVVQILFYLNLV